MVEKSAPGAATNHGAIISIVLAVLTILSLCIAIAPIPLTGFVCFPAAAVLGGLAFATGIASVRQIRSSREKGRTMALVATGIGALAATGAVCMMTLGVLMFSKIVDLLHQLAH